MNKQCSKFDMQVTFGIYYIMFGNITYHRRHRESPLLFQIDNFRVQTQVEVLNKGIRLGGTQNCERPKSTKLNIKALGIFP